MAGEDGAVCVRLPPARGERGIVLLRYYQHRCAGGVWLQDLLLGEL